MTILIQAWVETANDPRGPFPLNNLPFGVFSIGDAPRCGTAIGDQVLDLAALQSAGLLPGCGFDEPALNTFMGLGQQAWHNVTQELTNLLEALEPFRCATPKRDRELLPYIHDTGPMNYDIELSVSMAARGGEPTIISRTNYDGMYYSSAQQLAHHASSGCAMRTGDLLGSGTISGPKKGTYGSLLELSWGGEEPFTLDSGHTRTFIEDGDTLALHGHAQGAGYRLGFGPCAGTILQALPAATTTADPAVRK